jgi:hypothetical protein
MQGRPVEKVRAHADFVHEARHCRQLGRAVRDIRERHQQQHRARARGVAQGELQCGRRARGDAGYRSAFDLQRIQQAGVRIRLSGRRSVARQRRAQVPEAGHRDDAQAGQFLRNAQRLVEAAAGAMHEEQDRSLAGRGIFDRAARGLHDRAAGRHARAMPLDVVPEVHVNEGAEDQERSDG